MNVRESLQNARPHVSLRAGFKALIQQSRSLRKQGETVAVKGRPDIDRFLAGSLSDSFDPCRFKELLWTLINAETPQEKDFAALALNGIISSVNGPQASGDVNLRIAGGPDWLSSKSLDAWLGSRDRQLKLPVRQASAFVHHLDGYNVGGHPLDVQTTSPLPSVKRADRGRQRAQNVQPWLPFTDEIGRYSATPESIAGQHAEFFASFKGPVLDPFCGLGGDAIAFAQQGLDVHTAEIDKGRMALAKRNASAFKVDSRIHFYPGDGIAHLDSWVSTFPQYLLYLDPPWGGKDWDRSDMGLNQLFPRLDLIQDFIENAVAVTIKLPRSFRTDDLKVIPRQWRFHLGLGSKADHMADRLRLISAMAGSA